MSEEKINPNDLVAVIAKPRLTVSLIISFVVHVVLLILCSIGFLQLCFQYKTVHPKEAIKLEQKLAKEEAEKKEKEEKLKLAQLRAKEEAEKKAAEEKAKQSVQPAERKKSKIEQQLEETLPPSSASGSLDGGLSL